MFLSINVYVAFSLDIFASTSPFHYFFIVSHLFLSPISLCSFPSPFSLFIFLLLSQFYLILTSIIPLRFSLILNFSLPFHIFPLFHSYSYFPLFLFSIYIYLSTSLSQFHPCFSYPLPSHISNSLFPFPSCYTPLPPPPPHPLWHQYVKAGEGSLLQVCRRLPQDYPFLPFPFLENFSNPTLSIFFLSRTHSCAPLQYSIEVSLSHAIIFFHIIEILHFVGMNFLFSFCTLDFFC